MISEVVGSFWQLFGVVDDRVVHLRRCCGHAGVTVSVVSPCRRLAYGGIRRRWRRRRYQVVVRKSLHLLLFAQGTPSVELPGVACKCTLATDMVHPGTGHAL